MLLIDKQSFRLVCIKKSILLSCVDGKITDPGSKQAIGRHLLGAGASLASMATPRVTEVETATRSAVAHWLTTGLSPCGNPVLGMGGTGIVLKMADSVRAESAGADDPTAVKSSDECCVKIVSKEGVPRLRAEVTAHQQLLHDGADVAIYSPMDLASVHITEGATATARAQAYSSVSRVRLTRRRCLQVSER